MAGMGMSIAEQQQVMKFNAAKRFEQRKELNEINKATASNAVWEKNLVTISAAVWSSSAAGIAGDIKDGDYVSALNRMAGPGATLTALQPPPVSANKRVDSSTQVAIFP